MVNWMILSINKFNLYLIVNIHPTDTIKEMKNYSEECNQTKMPKREESTE